MKNNIKNAREQANMTQQECADFFEVGLRAWQTYEQGRSEPKNELLIRMADHFNVTLDYLLGREKKEQTAVEQFADDFNMTALEREILKNYVELPKDMRDDFMNFLSTAVNNIMQEEKEPIRTELIEISINYAPVSAGIGDELEDYERWGKVKVPLTAESRKADFILRVDGDSMEPKYSNGDYVLIRRQLAVDIGQIGIFEVDKKGYIKKFDGDYLISLNPESDDIPLKGKDYNCFGLVLGKIDIVE